MTTANQNIILSKIDKVRSLFVKEVNKNRQLVVCKMNYLDVDVLDSFCLVEDSNYGKLDHIIIPFKSEFKASTTYSNELVNELIESFDTTKNMAGNNEWVLKNWNPAQIVEKEKTKTTPAFFFRVLQSMIDAAPDFESKIFVFLSPKRLENKQQLAIWINEALKERLPERCGILVTEDMAEDYLNAAVKNHPAKASVIIPDLQMDKAIKQMATAGNPTKPDVQFRKYLFTMLEGVGEKDANHISKWRSKAKELATKEEWKDMIVTTDLAAGTCMLHIKATEKAIQYYNEAIENGRELIKTNPRMGNPLTIQAMAAKGAALVSEKKYNIASTLYEDLGGFAANATDYFNAMEAWRMAGYCYRQMNQRKKALDSNTFALTAADHMDPSLRPHTTLPYVGKELFELMPKDELGRKTLKEIDLKLKNYVGDEWQTRYK